MKGYINIATTHSTHEFVQEYTLPDIKDVTLSIQSDSDKKSNVDFFVLHKTNGDIIISDCIYKKAVDEYLGPWREMLGMKTDQPAVHKHHSNYL